MDLFASLLGGKENLPPKLPAASPPTASGAAKADAAEYTTQTTEDVTNPPAPTSDPVTDAFGNVKTIDEYLAEIPSSAAGTSKPKSNGYSTAEPPMGVEDYPLDSRMGEESPVGTSFCPFPAIARFPYKFAPANYMQPIATAYFDKNQIYEREWDLFYVWHEGKVIPFVPQIQVDALLTKVNADFPINWQFTKAHKKDGLLINFTDTNANLRPRFLGHANTRDQYDYLIEKAPADPNVDSMFLPEDRSLAAFKAHMDNAAYISKAKSKAKRQAKQGETIIKRQEMTKQVLRAQRYLGLSVKKDETSLMPDVAGLSLTPINVERSVPHPRDMDTIIIAIDVEAWERNHNTITEVGVATLDTRDLASVSPGENGKNWRPLIRARHFRVEENKHYVNHDFVSGCPDRFEFSSLSPAEGSEFVPLGKMASILTSCFHAPFSASLASPTDTEKEEKRNLILLGHDTNADIAYCHSLGFSVLNRGNLLETLDTAAMYRSYTRDANARSLGNVINAFDLTGWNLHNAGNDAVYTIWAMLAICVQEAAERGSEGVEAGKVKREEERKKVLVEQAEERAREEGEGWERSGDEDGGVAVPPEEPRPKRRAPGFYTMGGAVLDV